LVIKPNNRIEPFKHCHMSTAEGGTF